MAIPPTPASAQNWGSDSQWQARSARDQAAANAYGQSQGGDYRSQDAWDDRPGVLTPAQRRKRAKNNQIAGCVMGGVLGGLLGAAVSNRQNRGAAIATGAAMGCMAGFAFAANWSKRDQDALQAETEEVFDANQAQSEVWTAPESRQQVQLTSTPAVVETQRVDFEHYEDVKAPQAGAQVISRPYRTTDVLRLRSSPDAISDDNIVGRFERGEVVEVIGASADGQWAMIGYDGVIVGYSSFDYLADLDARQTLRTIPTAKPRRERPAVTQVASAPKSRSRSTSMAAASTSVQGGAPKIKTTKIMASTRCKSVVAVSGQQSDRKKGCAQPTGDWKFA